MNEPAGPPMPPAKSPSAAGWAARGALGAMIATSAALVTVVALGVISWETVRGFQGVGISAAVGAVAGVALRGPGPRAARVLGGGLGGGVAGYFALAAGESFGPGTAGWAFAGGSFAALLALPVAALVGSLVARLGAAFGPSSPGGPSS